MNVSEGASVGDAIFQFSVTDADDGVNAALYFEIVEGNNEGKFI